MALNLVAAALLVANSQWYRVNFDSLLAVWSDVVRDADKVGLGFTTLDTADEITIGDGILNAYYVRNIELGTARARYISDIGSRIAAFAKRKDIPYQFHIVRSGEVNAYAIPGGHVFITTGMLARIKTEGELASILGHEISHVDLRHAVERVQTAVRLQQVLGDLGQIIALAHDLIASTYSKDEETEADHNGMLLMADAGYSPVESIGIFVRIERELAPPRPIAKTGGGPETEVLVSLGKLLEDYFKTHPDWIERVAELEKVLKENESAWTGKDFCVGEWNYTSLVPCSTQAHPEEMIRVSPDSGEYQLRLGILADGAGQVQEARRHLTAALRALPTLPRTTADSGRVQRSANDLTEALAAFNTALKLELLQLEDKTLWPQGAAETQLRTELWRSYADQVSTVTALGQRDFFALPMVASDYAGVETDSLCRIAVNAQGTRWRSDVELKLAVAEAIARHLSVDQCRAAAGLPALTPAYLSTWRDGLLCSTALSAAGARWDASLPQVMTEVRKRSLSITQCRAVLGLPHLAPSSGLEGLSDQQVCVKALDDTASTWTTDVAPLLEAARRALTLEECRQKIATAGSVQNQTGAQSKGVAKGVAK